MCSSARQTVDNAMRACVHDGRSKCVCVEKSVNLVHENILDALSVIN
jgi:hypothetical protein